jgi:hypothetical protein
VRGANVQGQLRVSSDRCGVTTPPNCWPPGCDLAMLEPTPPPTTSRRCLRRSTGFPAPIANTLLVRADGAGASPRSAGLAVKRLKVELVAKHAWRIGPRFLNLLALVGIA